MASVKENAAGRQTSAFPAVAVAAQETSHIPMYSEFDGVQLTSGRQTEESVQVTRSSPSGIGCFRPEPPISAACGALQSGIWAPLCRLPAAVRTSRFSALRDAATAQVFVQHRQREPSGIGCLKPNSHTAERRMRRRATASLVRARSAPMRRQAHSEHDWESC